VHHFLGDQSFLPAAFVMAAAVQPPAQAVVTLTVPTPEDRLELVAAACPEGVTWVEAGEDDAATGLALLAASGLDGPGDGVVAYVGGEMTLASTIRSALVRDGGWPRESVMPKPYWRRGAPNARHGEPGRD
jgi:NADPH-dependent ferric siderophore reductase